ncbi:MAG: hypothetical protein EOO61_18365 [Hymenobacter sp.]|nr:MAG: hypothetical protein EOO61_18365 [Hymenobacter sp.]
MLPVKIAPLVDQKLDELFDVLLEENYFSDEENSRAYCNNIRTFIKSLPNHKYFSTKNKLWGTYYAAYKANRRTTWYITFDTVAGKGYLVRNIFNNHTEEYPRFING